jgi:hypothetical protein
MSLEDLKKNLIQISETDKKQKDQSLLKARELQARQDEFRNNFNQLLNSVIGPFLDKVMQTINSIDGFNSQLKTSGIVYAGFQSVGIRIEHKGKSIQLDIVGNSHIQMVDFYYYQIPPPTILNNVINRRPNMQNSPPQKIKNEAIEINKISEDFLSQEINNLIETYFKKG